MCRSLNEPSGLGRQPSGSLQYARSVWPAHEGPNHHAIVDLWTYDFPLDAESADQLAFELATIPPLLEQARGNLTGDARELWIGGIENLRGQASALSDLAATLEGGTYVKIVYSSPRKRGRTIFGGLVPFGEIWRTGANEATEITSTGPIVLGTSRLETGTYSLFTIPDENSWTIRTNWQHRPTGNLETSNPFSACCALWNPLGATRWSHKQRN